MPVERNSLDISQMILSIPPNFAGIKPMNSLIFNPLPATTLLQQARAGASLTAANGKASAHVLDG